MSAAPVLVVEGLAKAYGDSRVFSGVALRLEPGEFVALLGESGVGKSTLLNCIAGLDEPDAGRIVVAGTELAALDEPGRARLRRERLRQVHHDEHPWLPRPTDERPLPVGWSGCIQPGPR